MIHCPREPEPATTFRKLLQVEQRINLFNRRQTGDADDWLAAERQLEGEGPLIHSGLTRSLGTSEICIDPVLQRILETGTLLGPTVPSSPIAFACHCRPHSSYGKTSSH